MAGTAACAARPGHAPPFTFLFMAFAIEEARTPKELPMSAAFERSTWARTPRRR